MSGGNDYALGYSTEEERRLAMQAGMFEVLTEDVFRHAGLSTGMHVLDIGCGVGDVSFLAARLVGPSGSVIGIDRGEESVETARRRAKRLGIDNATFFAAEVSDFETGSVFDAIVGRLILLYLPDPAQILRRLSSHLRAGGVMAFQEMDMSTFLSRDAAPLITRVATWIYDAFGAAGAQREMGPRLPDIFMQAGFSRPEMIAGQTVVNGVEPSSYILIAGLARSLLPVMERAKIATAEEVGVDTLAERLIAEAIDRRLSVAYRPRLVGAWARKG
jgi:ubiquinone/menaquinone biosynthesis C-methylase UbiE